jgi:sulfite reductase beta subunit-like hemoprotein
MNSTTKETLPGKLLGTYPQKQDGLYMQRVPVFAGQITAGQLRHLAEMAINYTGGSALHLTTRQDIELHNVRPEHLNTIQNRLHEIGLVTVGAGGDSVRNITVCPCCRFNPSAYDVQPLAAFVKELLSESPLLENMPRKFKLSFAGCSKPQSRPFANDLSFIVTSATSVRVIGAGSLGAKPEAGIVLYDQMGTEDVIPLTLAAIELFNEHGDRENRRKARLRHIRQRLGNEAFIELLNTYFARRKKSHSWAKIKLTHGWMGWSKKRTIQTIAGDLDPHHALTLAEIASHHHAQIRINPSHGLDIFARQSFELGPELESLRDLPKIVACPGSATCKNGLVNCPHLAAELAKILKGNLKTVDKTIAISGCPNNCVHSAIADIGLVGRIKTIDGKRQEAYKVMLNGGNGIDDTLGETIEIVSAEDLPARILEYLERLNQRD